MSQELLYTSAPKGLKSGSHGFCMVLCSEGMPAPLATALEGLSAYKPVYPVGDPSQDKNPVTAMHVILPAIGRKQHVLSRVASYGLDYSGRPNKLAHHVVLEARDLSPAGPAWMLAQPGVMKSEWSGEPKVVAANRRLANGDVQPAPCRSWARVTGDAGWAGVLAESLMKDPTRLAYLIIEPGLDVLPLFAEAIALLPSDRRWQATFSTYFTTLPAGATCNWRCLLADSPLVHQSKRHVHALRLDFTRPLGKAPDGEWVEFARTGKRARVEELTQPVAPAVVSRPAVPACEGDAYDLSLPIDDDSPPSYGRRRRSRSIAKRKSALLISACLVVAAGIAAIAILPRRPTDKLSSTGTEVPDPVIASENPPPVSSPPLNAGRDDLKNPTQVATNGNTEAKDSTTDPGSQSSKPIEPQEPAISASGVDAQPAIAKRKPLAITEWIPVTVTEDGSSQSIRVPIASVDLKELRFFVPDEIVKQLAPPSARTTRSQVKVELADKLNPESALKFCSVELADDGQLRLTLDDHFQRQFLDGCVILLTSQNEDVWKGVLWTDRQAALARTQTHAALSKGFGNVDPIIRQVLPFSTPGRNLPPLTVSSFTLQVGDRRAVYAPMLRQVEADGTVHPPILTKKHVAQNLDLEQPSKLLADLALRDNPSKDSLPTLTIRLKSPDQQHKAGLVEVEWKVPADIGDFLKQLNQKLNLELEIIRQTSVSRTDPSRTGEKKDKEFALPELTFERIELPETAAPDLETMQRGLTASLDAVTKRIARMQEEPKSEATPFVEYENQLKDLQKKLKQYQSQCKSALALKRDLAEAKVVEGHVSYTVKDTGDHKTELQIPAFDAPPSQE